jgi:hypothetical protein
LQKKVFLTKSTKYDIKPMDFWLRVVMAEWGEGSAGVGEKKAFDKSSRRSLTADG